MPWLDAITRPYYTIDHDNDVELLKWFKELVLWRQSDSDEVSRIEKQTTNLAIYLNYSPASQRVFAASSSGSLSVFEKRDYFHLIDPLVASAVNNWVSRLTLKNPVFSVFPKMADEPDIKAKASLVKSMLESVFQAQAAIELDELNIRNSFIFGESYLEIYWDESIGPLDPDVQADLDKRGPEALEDLGDYAQQIRLGNVAFRLRDPRNTIVQRASAYRKSEWTLFLSLELTEHLKCRSPDFADEIRESTDTHVYANDMLSPEYSAGYTLVYTFYHRPTIEVPQGAFILATPTCILSREPLPSNRWIKNQHFPVLQFTDTDVLGCSRGLSSTIMDSIIYGQIAHNNLWLQALTNLMVYSPKLLVQKGSLDLSHMRASDRAIISYGKSYAPPSMMAQEVVSQSHLLLLDKLKDSILKAINVMPVSRGDPMPNVESRQMLDFMKDQENLQSMPKDAKHSRFLKEWAMVAFELMADKYQDENIREFSFLNRIKKPELISLTGKDLTIDVDIYVEPINAMAGTLEGRLKEIQQIMQVMPGYYSPEEMVEKLDIGSPDKVYDEVTAAMDSARHEVDQILSGKDVQSPSRRLNLLTYYDVYVQCMQRKDIQALLPEIFDPAGKDVGNKFLLQVMSLEELILAVMNDTGMTGPNGVTILKGDMPLIMPQFGMPPGTTFRQYVFGRHPSFPRVYVPDSIDTVNPLELQGQSLPAMAPPMAPPGMGPPGMGPQAPSQGPSQSSRPMSGQGPPPQRINMPPQGG